jgi:hypothetical protein
LHRAANTGFAETIEGIALRYAARYRDRYVWTSKTSFLD